MERKIRVAMLGMGNMGRTHIAQLRKMDDVEVVALCSVTDDAKKYNEENGITPQTIKKSVREVIEATKPAEDDSYEGKSPLELTKKELAEYIKKMEKEMKQAAKMMEFEYAAVLRDQIIKLRGSEKGR